MEFSSTQFFDNSPRLLLSYYQFGAYDEDERQRVLPDIIAISIFNMSQAIGMYCLNLSYRVNKDELRPVKPVPKFSSFLIFPRTKTNECSSIIITLFFNLTYL